MSNREAGQNVTFNPKTFIGYLLISGKQPKSTIPICCDLERTFFKRDYPVTETDEDRAVRMAQIASVKILLQQANDALTIGNKPTITILEMAINILNTQSTKIDKTNIFRDRGEK